MNNITDILKICCVLLDITKKHKLILELYGSVQKKIFPEINEPIKPININSGYSMRDGYSVVFRKEEMFKVAIHELLHQLGVHLSLQIMQNDIKLYFNYEKNGNILIDEAYIELYACILNLLYISNKYKLDFSYLLDLEIKFSLLQIAKLMIHFGINDYNNFFINNNTYGNIKTLKAYDTHPEAYIIIKTAMLYNLINTMNKFSKNGINIFMNYDYNGVVDQEMLGYILDICKNEDFKKDINYLIHNNHKYIKNEFIKNTCRMTCIELYI